MLDSFPAQRIVTAREKIRVPVYCHLTCVSKTGARRTTTHTGERDFKFLIFTFQGGQLKKRKENSTFKSSE